MRGSDVLAGLCGQMARSCRKSPLGGAWQCVKASHLRARLRMDPFGTPTVKKPRPETFRKFRLCTDLRPVGQTVSRRASDASDGTRHRRDAEKLSTSMPPRAVKMFPPEVPVQMLLDTFCAEQSRMPDEHAEAIDLSDVEPAARRGRLQQGAGRHGALPECARRRERRQARGDARYRCRLARRSGLCTRGSPA